MSINIWKRRADAPAGWQPIGLPDRAAPALVRRETTPALRNAIRHLAGPAAALTASVAVISVAAVSPSAQAATTASTLSAGSSGNSTTLAASSDPQTPVMAQPVSAPNTGSSTTTSTTTTSTGTAPSSSSSTSATSPLSQLPTSDLPTGNLPVVGGFVNHAPEIFTGGLFGGDTVQTSVDPNQSGGAHSTGDTSSEGGGDMCDFFLQHMWKNEDGLPLLGSSSHVLTYHTDPAYKNLILSTASGAIGNSEMPVIDIYGGPLGWIPIFNPSHVRGHGTDYVTLLTGCGGMGLPINTKNLSLDLNKVPTPEKVLNFANKVMPNVPNISKILGPDYLYNTLQTKEVMSRLGPKTVFTPDEYLAFAGKNFDVFRMLWQTALQQVTSGNPTGVLDVLKVTDNIQTLQSLGLPGLPGSSGSTLTTGLLDDGSSSTSKTNTDSTTPSSGQPSSDQPSSEQPGSTDSSTTKTTDSSTTSSNPLDTLTSTLGSLTGGLSLPGSTSPSSDQPGSADSTTTTSTDSTTPSSEQPGSTDSSTTKTTDSSTTSSNPLDTLTSTLGSLTGGLSLPGTTSPSPEQPSSDQPSSTDSSTTTTTTSTSSTTPSSDQPSSDQPSSDQPSSDQPGSTDSSTTTATDSSSSSPLSTLTRTLGSLTSGLSLRGTTSPSSNQPSSDQPSSTDSSTTTTNTTNTTTPGSDQPSSSQPGSTDSSTTTTTDSSSSNPLSTVTDTLGSVTGGGSQPAGSQPSGDQPSQTNTEQSQTTTQQSQTSQSAEQDTLSFEVGKPAIDNQAAGRAPGATVEPGSTMTIQVPVTNNGGSAITDVKAQVPGDQGLTDMECSNGTIQPGATAVCQVQVPAQSGNVKMSMNVIATSDDGQQMTKLCSLYYEAQPTAPRLGFTGKTEFNGQSIAATTQAPISTTEPSSLTFEVVNQGNAPTTSISGTSSAGAVTCGSQQLEPGQTTNCTVTFTPKAGSNDMSIQMSGHDQSGHVSNASFGFSYTANPPTSVPAAN